MVTRTTVSDGGVDWADWADGVGAPQSEGGGVGGAGGWSGAAVEVLEGVWRGGEVGRWVVWRGGVGGGGRWRRGRCLWGDGGVRVRPDTSEEGWRVAGVGSWVVGAAV